MPRTKKEIEEKKCPEGKKLNPKTNRCRNIRKPKEPTEPKEPKKRGRPAKNKDPAVVPPAPSIPLSVLPPSLIPALPAPPPSETPPPILPVNNSSNYKKRIEKRKYNKPVKVIKQKKQVPIPLVNNPILNRDDLIKKGKEILKKNKQNKLLNILLPSLPSLDINEMSKFNPKPTFNKLQNKIMDSSSRKRNMLDKDVYG